VVPVASMSYWRPGDGLKLPTLPPDDHTALKF
jgi:hypothetical protein